MCLQDLARERRGVDRIDAQRFKEVTIFGIERGLDEEVLRASVDGRNDRLQLAPYRKRNAAGRGQPLEGPGILTDGL